MRHHRDRSSLFTGLLFIGIGTLFLLDRLDVADFGDLIRTWWPMFLVFIGVSRFFERRRVWSGAWLIAVGLWLQATVLHLFGLRFNNSWPLLLIALGAVMTLRALFDTVTPAADASMEKRHES
jgi:hypothetical protein